MVNFFERMFSKGEKARSEDSRFNATNDAAREHEYDLPPGEIIDKGMTFAPIESKKDTPFQAAARAVTHYLFKDATLHPEETHPRPDIDTTIHVLAQAALDNEYDGETGIGLQASNLLYQLLYEAVEDTYVPLPNLELAKQWLEAREKLDQMEVDQYKRRWNPLSTFKQKHEESLSRELSLLEQLAATTTPRS